jgi:hypothetical protein
MAEEDLSAIEMKLVLATGLNKVVVTAIEAVVVDSETKVAAVVVDLKAPIQALVHRIETTTLHRNHLALVAVEAVVLSRVITVNKRVTLLAIVRNRAKLEVYIIQRARIFVMYKIIDI